MKVLFSSLLFALAAASKQEGRGLQQPTTPTALRDRWDMDEPKIVYVPDDDKFTFTLMTASEDNYNQGLAESFWDPDCMPVDGGDGVQIGTPLIHQVGDDNALPFFTMEDVTLDPVPASGSLSGLRPRMEFKINPAKFASEGGSTVYSGTTPSCDTTGVRYSFLLNNMKCPDASSTNPILFGDTSGLSEKECYLKCANDSSCTQFSLSGTSCVGCGGTAESLVPSDGLDTYEMCDPKPYPVVPLYTEVGGSTINDCTDTSTVVAFGTASDSYSCPHDGTSLFDISATKQGCYERCYIESNCDFFTFSTLNGGRCMGCTALGDASYPALKNTGSNPPVGYDMQVCEADCDGDSQCAGDLVCYERENDKPEIPYDPIPGCTGFVPDITDSQTYRLFWDICIDESTYVNYAMCPRPPTPPNNNARIDFCIRSSLGYTIESDSADLAPNPTTGTTEDSNYQEVNFIETLVRIEYDMSSGFEVASFSVAPKNRELTTISESYEDALTAYLCDTSTSLGVVAYDFDSTESYPGPIQPDPFNQGALITVCVRVKEEFASQNIVLKELTDFSWTRSGGSTFNRAIGGGGDDTTTITQVAITGSEAAGNYLTSYDKTDCENKYWCQFASVLFAQFYNTPGSVSGTGDAILQFKTARNRRLGEGVDDQRLLQEDPGSAGMDISIDVNGVAEGPGDLKTASGPSFGATTVSVSVVTALVGAILLA